MGPRFPRAGMRPREIRRCPPLRRLPQASENTPYTTQARVPSVQDLYGAPVEVGRGEGRRDGGLGAEGLHSAGRDAGRDAPQGEDDRRLLQRHVRGDRDAFPELVRRHRDRLWGVALRTVGNPDDAADALQEALISAYRRAESFRGDAAVTTWLHRIVVNACLDLLRRRQARPVQPLRPDSADPALPRDPIDDRQVRLDVAAALATLPVEQRVALVLVDIEGYPVAEVAAMLNVPAGTVKSRCARGRARLASILADYRNETRTGNVSPTSAASGPTGSLPPTTPAANPPGKDRR